jgi:hypothetical protein
MFCPLFGIAFAGQAQIVQDISREKQFSYLRFRSFSGFARNKSKSPG